MNHVIGIRVSPSCIFYSILKLSDDGTISVCDISSIVVPTMLDVPNQLAFIRTTLSTIILEYDIDIAGIRLNEPIAQNPSHFRINIEGVIQELFANSSIKSYYCGIATSISSVLGVPTTKVKEYHDGKSVFININNWKQDYKKEQREAIVIAFAALKNGGVSIA